MKTLILFLKTIIVISASIFAIYFINSSDAFDSYQREPDPYLLLSLFINLVALFLFSIQSRFNVKMDLIYYTHFAVNNFRLTLYRIKQLLKNKFWIVVLLSPIGILLDQKVIINYYSITLVVLIILQCLVTIFLSIVIFDILKKINADKQFFLIPFLIVAATNFSISQIDTQLFSLNPFGGLVFVPLYLFDKPSFLYMTIVGLEIVTLIFLIFKQLTLKIK